MKINKNKVAIGTIHKNAKRIWQIRNMIMSKSAVNVETIALARCQLGNKHNKYVKKTEANSYFTHAKLSVP